MAENIEFNLRVLSDGLKKTLEENTLRAGKLDVAIGSAIGNFAATAAIKGFELLSDSVSGLVNIVEDSVQASADQEQAIQNLNTALALTGKFSDEASQRIQNLANSIQRTTTVEDDAVLSTAALIQNLGKLSVDGLERATSAAVDLSAALGIDLDSAATLVGKAATGNIAAFGRFGVEIQKGTTDAETFANALNKIEKSFGGAAAAQAQTFGGSLIQLKNSIGDAQEELGNLITQNPAVIASFKTLQATVVAASDSFKGSFQGGGTGIEDFVKLTLDGTNAIVLALDALVRTIEATVDAGVLSFKTLALGFQTPIAGVLELLAAIPGVGTAFKEVADQATADMLRISDEVNKGFEDIQNFTTKETFLSGVSLGIAEARTNFELFLNEVKNAPAAVNNNPSPAPTQEIDQSVLDQRAALNAQLLDLDRQLEADRLAQSEQFRLAEIERTTANEQLFIQADLEAAKLKNEAALQAELDKAALLDDVEQRRLATQAANKKKELADEKAFGAARIATAKNTALLETQIEQSRLAAAQGFLSAGISLAKQGSKEQQALQVASATASTFTAANQALSSPPGPPFTLPLVGAVVAQGLANVSKIAKIGFANGGVVGSLSGATAGGDNAVATVREGEMILNAQQQEKLFNMINSGSLGGGDIVIQVDGREIARAVRKQKEMGFAV